MAFRLVSASRTLHRPVLGIQARATASFPIPSPPRFRTMATAEAQKYEWLVVVPDKPGMQAKRLEIRP